MRLGQFIDSAADCVDQGGQGVLDLEIKLGNRETGDFMDIDEIAIDAKRGELHVFFNTERRLMSPSLGSLVDRAAEHYGPADDLLADYNRGDTGRFYTSIFDAITCADSINMERLRIAFPAEVAAWDKWAAAEEPRLTPVDIANKLDAWEASLEDQQGH